MARICMHRIFVASGVGWKSDDASAFRSDVQLAVNDLPGVYGFDFIDGIETREEQAEEVFRHGGIVTFSWHAANPVIFRPFHENTNGHFWWSCSEGDSGWVSSHSCCQ